MPNIKRGADMRGLLHYLFGKGRANEHEDPHMVAGHAALFGRPDLTATMDPRADPAAAARLARAIADEIESPRRLHGTTVTMTNRRAAAAAVRAGTPVAVAAADATRDVPVWHCSLSLAPGEGPLTDDQWRQVAEEFMAKMGFDSPADVPARWVAVRHGLSKNGGDHVHIVASAVREDGRRVDTYKDFPRAQRACSEIEQAHQVDMGLSVLASRIEGGTERATRPDERQRRDRTGAAETDREALQRRVRALAAATGSEAEWIRELRAAGITIRPRYAKGSRTDVTGYSVQLPAQPNATGTLEKSIVFAGGDLARDLTLTALRDWAGWDRSPGAQAEASAEWGKSLQRPGRRPLTADPELAVRAAEDLARWTERLQRVPQGDRAGWARAASQAAGVAAAWSIRTEPTPGPLADLSRTLGRSAWISSRDRQTAPPPRHDRTASDVALLLMLGGPATATSDADAVLLALARLLQIIAAADRAASAHRRAAALAAESRRQLIGVHLQRAGLDPHAAPDLTFGSAGWAATERGKAWAEGGDLDAVEQEIATGVEVYGLVRKGRGTRAQTIAQQLRERGTGTTRTGSQQTPTQHPTVHDQDRDQGFER